jgi:hypothetical protein
MEDENLEILLTMLHEEISKNDFGEDNIRIEKLIKSLEDLKVKLPTKDELDIIDKEATYLDIKYDAFNELSCYFGPLHAKIEHEIHANEVNKLRGEMRERRKNKKNERF